MCTAANGTVYGWDVTTDRLITINTTTADSTAVGTSVSTTEPFQSLDFDRYGVLWGVSGLGNFYRINPTNGTVKLIARGLGDARGMVIPKHQGRLLATDSGTFASIDLATGLMTHMGVLTSSASLAALPNGTLWGEKQNRIGSVNPGSGLISDLATGTPAFVAMSAIGTTLYGIANITVQHLYRIDTSTGATTDLGSTGRAINSLQSMTTSPSGVLYAYDTTLGLVTINSANGAVTDVSAANGADTRIRAIEFGLDGVLYGGKNQLFVIDPATGLVTETIGGNAYTNLAALAAMPPNGYYLGCSSGGAGSIHRMNIPGITSTQLSSGTATDALCRTPEGTILALSTSGVRVVNRSTGAVSNVVYALPAGAARYGMSMGDDDQFELAASSAGTFHFDSYERVFGNLISSATSGAGSLINDLAETDDGSVFGIPFDSSLSQVDPESGQISSLDPTSIGGSTNFLVVGNDGYVYGGSLTTLFRIDPRTGSDTSMGNLSFGCTGVAFSPPVSNGTIMLEDLAVPMYTQTVVVEIRHPGTTLVIETHRPRVTAFGVVEFASRLFGTYDVSVKGRHWLRRVVTNVNLSNGGLFAASLSLKNGDADGDNEVGIGDYSAISTAYNSFEGDPNWNPDADLNGDGGVDIGDYSILSANYGQAGDD